MRGLPLAPLPCLFSPLSPRPANAPQVPPNHQGLFEKGCFLLKDLQTGLLGQDLDLGALESALTSPQVVLRVQVGAPLVEASV